MKATDLMIGDYARVNRDGLCIKEGSVVVIRGIEADDKLKLEGKCLVGGAHCHPLDEEQFDGGIWCEYLDPIPLTREILEMNGLSKLVTYGTEKWVCDKFRLNEYDNKGVWRFCAYTNRNEDSVIYIRYVHDLQHALKICGIKKEITL